MKTLEGMPGAGSQVTWGRVLYYLPYLIAAAVLLFLLLHGEKFWLTNDEIRMGMTVGGYGIAAAPSPGLVLETNVIWGWLLEQVPDVAGIRGYTLASYALLFLSGAALTAALEHLKVPRLFTAAVLLAIYAGALLFPQFTLLSGYLAAAGFALVLASDEPHPYPWMAGAALCLLLAGLIRPDELALLFLVISPFLLQAWLDHREWRWRLHWLGLAGVCIALLAAAYLYNLHYSTSGAWQQFGDIDALRGEFTDYNLAAYFVQHPEKLAGSGIDLNDIKLMANWFYADTKFFDPAHFAPLVQSVTLADRFDINADRLSELLEMLRSMQFVVLLAMFAVIAVLNWRRPLPEIASLALLVLLMIGISLWGRPDVVRIYMPVVAGMVVLALLKRGAAVGRLTAVAGVVLLALSLYFSWDSYHQAHKDELHARIDRTVTCAGLPKDQLLLIWTGGGKFEWKDIYRPTTPVDDPCNPPLYSLGSYQLAPPSLARLYAYTGGKGLVEALLAGQRFYLITSEGRLRMLTQYLQDHYGATLQSRLESKTIFFELFSIQVAHDS